MLRDKRSDYPKAVTPRGVAIFPALTRPDFKFKTEFGEYHCRLRLSPDAPGLDDLIAQAEAILDEAFEAKKAELTRQKKGALLKQLYKIDILKPELDRESGEETGFVVLRASANAGGKKKDGSIWKGRIDLFNRKGEQLKNPLEIGSGSELKLGVRIMDYETDGGKGIGVRFELEGAQLLKVASGGARTAADHGFGAEEDGNDIEDQAASPGFSDEGGSGDAGDDGDF
ncbi:hypothetical protein [Novosphingobium meiothermophilum]|uniref:hypothetical protein n=1 Tax=Novosphingobium meiothermophilum TaxID=2202251 RepID=UPI0011AB3C61|nr:hypothetical protein [Novosphingobium meiothermophilum]